MTTFEIDSDGLNDVEAALIAEVVSNLHEYSLGGLFGNIENARIALDTLVHYVYETQKGPATFDDDGEILNHGRCAV